MTPTQQSNKNSPRIFFIANGLFGGQMAGGDIHLLHTIRAVTQADWHVECFSGRALERHLREWNLPANVIFTDRPGEKPLKHGGLLAQIHLFLAFFCRFAATLKKMKLVQTGDVIFSPTDYWFDVLPVAFSRAKTKVVVLQMQAPSLREVIFRTRPDIEASRIASLHYCLSQWLSLAMLRHCRHKCLIVVQPLLKTTALKMGFQPSEVVCIPNGVDVEAADSAPEQQKQFDVVWMGRIHRQKGIDDLLKTLQSLAKNFTNFRALLIGNLQSALGGKIAEMDLTGNVEFSGYVSGAEKFRLLKSARVFLMPSRHEGLPIVVGEALACGLPVVAYELEMYRPFFGSLLHYVPCFDIEQFCSTSGNLLKRLRAGEQLIDNAELAHFKQINSWREIERQLADLMEKAI